MAKDADPKIVRDKMLKIKSFFVEKKQQQFQKDQEREKEEANQQLLERKLNYVHIPGIKRTFNMRSEKQAVKSREVKREILSNDQIDIQKYLGLQLTEVEERKGRGS